VGQQLRWQPPESPCAQPEVACWLLLVLAVTYLIPPLRAQFGELITNAAAAALCLRLAKKTGRQALRPDCFYGPVRPPPWIRELAAAAACSCRAAVEGTAA